MPYTITGSESFLLFALVCCYFFEVEPLTSTSLFLPPPHSTSTPPLPFLMAVQSDPPLAQSWPITPHPNQGAGWRRWRASGGPLTRYRSEWQIPVTVYHKEGDRKDTGLLPLASWSSSGFSPRLQAPRKWRFFHCNGLTEHILSGTHFVIFVTPLASLLCQPFKFEQRGTGDTGSFFTGSICVHLVTLWAIDWWDCIITSGYRYVYRTRIATQWFAV